MRRIHAILLPAIMLNLVGCLQQQESGNTSSPVAQGGNPQAAAADKKVVMISLTSDAKADPQSVNMGLTLAKFCSEEGYDVALFFNVKGVQVPTKSFPDDFQYLKHDPLKAQIKALSDAGVEVHVCPVCMADLDVTEDDIMEGAFVTSKPKLFAKLGPSTSVFTY